MDSIIMIGIVLPSIVLPMTAHPNNLVKPEPDLTPPESSADKKTGLWLCIGDHEDIANNDPLIFRTSPLLVGERAGDEQVTGLTGLTPVYTSLNHRQSPARNGSP
jgi:hypothetical protein